MKFALVCLLFLAAGVYSLPQNIGIGIEDGAGINPGGLNTGARADAGFDADLLGDGGNYKAGIGAGAGANAQFDGSGVA